MNWRAMGLTLGTDSRGRNTWHGSLHAIALWNRVLGDDEVRASVRALRTSLSR